MGTAVIAKVFMVARNILVVQLIRPHGMRDHGMRDHGMLDKGEKMHFLFFLFCSPAVNSIFNFFYITSFFKLMGGSFFLAGQLAGLG
jgi:hypothetical protein